MEVISIEGNWELISIYNSNTESTNAYPESIETKLFVRFNKDSVFVNACDRDLGASKYSISEKKLDIEKITYILNCTNVWVSSVVLELNNAISASLDGDTLEIY